MSNMIDLAMAQFIGFHHGRWNRDDVMGLVTAMNLTKEEWEQLKRDETMEIYLTSSQIQEIDDSFKDEEIEAEFIIEHENDNT